MQVVKHYKVTNWCNYSEIESLPQMKLPPEKIAPYLTTGGHVCSVELWLNEDTGEGYETRTFTLK